MSRQLKCLASLLIGIFAFCQIARAAGSDSEIELHRSKAERLIEAKDWGSAEKEAKAIVDTNAQDMDGWLMYGIIEQRLEHNDEAISAYHKYLDLNPPK